MSDINIGVDVDGTLTNEIIGKEILTDSSIDIEGAMLDCTPKDGIDILLDADINIYIITGRNERYKEVTVEWLKTYGIPYSGISMFPDDHYVIYGYDIPKYVELKLDLHMKVCAHCALDDSKEVVNKLNEYGIHAYQVEDNFRYAFEKVLMLNDNIKCKSNKR